MTIKVLDKGYVQLRDHMGTDLTVVNAARVSFAKESDALNADDRRLLKFLARSGHWSPFAHPKVSLEVKAPMFVVNQWYRTAIDSVYSSEHHAWNEVSRRYVTEEPEVYVPRAWRSAPKNKKQGSAGELSAYDSDHWSSQLAGEAARALQRYDQAIAAGVAPEQARLFLPAYALYTTFYWTASLSTVIRWLKERLASDAQSEIREYAAAVEELVRPLFPESFAAHGLTS